MGSHPLRTGNNLTARHLSKHKTQLRKKKKRRRKRIIEVEQTESSKRDGNLVTSPPPFTTAFHHNRYLYISPVIPSSCQRVFSCVTFASGSVGCVVCRLWRVLFHYFRHRFSVAHWDSLPCVRPATEDWTKRHIQVPFLFFHFVACSATQCIKRVCAFHPLCLAVAIAIVGAIFTCARAFCYSNIF